jgi:hypothetical protein
MLPIDKCLFCEGKLSQKTVTEIIKNDEDTVSLSKIKRINIFRSGKSSSQREVSYCYPSISIK